MNSALPKSRLGRGLASLIGDGPQQIQPRIPAEGEHRLLAVAQLRSGRFNPRKDFAEQDLAELAESIRTKGLVQPIVVRPHPEDMQAFEIVAGERRWRAAQLAGLKAVPVVVREIPDSAAIAMALIENIQRENLNPLEEALAIRRLIDEFGLTHEEAAEAIGRSRVAVSNLLRLMQLGEPARELLQKRAIEMGHARALLALTEGRMQAEVARLVATRGLSVRETERLVKKMLEGPQRSGGEAAGPGRSTDPDVRRLENDLAEKLGARVAIQHGRGGKGKLVVSYNSIDELEGILGHIS